MELWTDFMVMILLLRFFKAFRRFTSSKGMTSRYSSALIEKGSLYEGFTPFSLCHDRVLNYESFLAFVEITSELSFFKLLLFTLHRSHKAYV